MASSNRPALGGLPWSGVRIVARAAVVQQPLMSAEGRLSMMKD